MKSKAHQEWNHIRMVSAGLSYRYVFGCGPSMMAFHELIFKAYQPWRPLFNGLSRQEIISLATREPNKTRWKHFYNITKRLMIWNVLHSEYRDRTPLPLP